MEETMCYSTEMMTLPSEIRYSVDKTPWCSSGKFWMANGFEISLNSCLLFSCSSLVNTGTPLWSFFATVATIAKLSTGSFAVVKASRLLP